MLTARPLAFTSDAETERLKPAASYLSRFDADTGSFTFGAWRDEQLVGAVTCKQDRRQQARHIWKMLGMMVTTQWEHRGIGRSLLAACFGQLRSRSGSETMTLSVTATNFRAIEFYELAGFTRYGTLPGAVKINDRFHDKHLMMLKLA